MVQNRNDEQKQKFPTDKKLVQMGIGIKYYFVCTVWNMWNYTFTFTINIAQAWHKTMHLLIKTFLVSLGSGSLYKTFKGSDNISWQFDQLNDFSAKNGELGRCTHPSFEDCILTLVSSLWNVPPRSFRCHIAACYCTALKVFELYQTYGI